MNAVNQYYLRLQTYFQSTKFVHCPECCDRKRKKIKMMNFEVVKYLPSVQWPTTCKYLAVTKVSVKKRLISN